MTLPEHIQIKRKSPEIPDEQGDYLFKHKFVATQGARELLSMEDLMYVTMYLRNLAKENKGIDYMQVFTKGDTTFWAIDQLSITMISEGHYTDEQGYATILLPSEY